MEHPNGVLLVDKPAGLTSFGAINKIKKRFGLKKIGHAGTLDPDATGLLKVCIGQATKISSYLMEGNKTYEFECFFGKMTDTLDNEGKITALSDKVIEKEEIENTLPSFIGETEQVPPKFSAIKVKGKKLYEYARRDLSVNIPTRNITVHAIDLVEYNFPIVKMRVVCSKGTYVRALARDIAAKLDTLAIAQNIHRTQSGDLNLSKANSLDKILEFEMADFLSALIPIPQALSFLPTIIATPQQEKEVGFGRALESPKDLELQDLDVVLLNSENQKALALMEFTDGFLKVKRGF